MTYEGCRVLVTGNSGFIGNHLTAALAEAGAMVVPFDQSEGMDITDWGQVREIGGVDAVFHLAARASVPLSWENPEETARVNVQGTKNMLEYCRVRDVKRFVFPSTYVYGPPQYLPIDEGHPTNPNNPYAQSKLEGEKLCEKYHAEYGIDCLVMRLFNIYGPGQIIDFLIPTILSQLKSGKINLADSRPKRDFVYVKDVMEAFLLCGEKGTGFNIYNIGSGMCISIGTVVSTIAGLYGKKLDVSYRNEVRKNEVLDIYADINKAKKQLGWQPRYSFEQGMRETLQSVLKP